MGNAKAPESLNHAGFFLNKTNNILHVNKKKTGKIMEVGVENRRTNHFFDW